MVVEYDPFAPENTFKSERELINDLSLLDPKAIKGLAEVRREGDGKHGSYNWTTGSRDNIDHAQAILRHFTRWLNGEDKDESSGQHPMYHIMCRAMFIAANPPSRDNRMREEKK